MLRLWGVVLAAVILGDTARGGSFVFVSLLDERRILTFERHLATGHLSFRSAAECPAEPAYQTASPDGKLLFVSFRSTGQLAAFRIDPMTGQLTLLNTTSGGDDPAFLKLDRTGRYLLTAYYVSDKVTVHSVSSEGQLSERPVQTVFTARNAHGIAFDSQNQSVYVSHTGGNRIDQFRFLVNEGRLQPLEMPFLTANEGENPRHVVLHPNDRWVYCSNEAGGSTNDGVSFYERDLKSFQLTQKQSTSSLPTGADAIQNSTAECLLSPNGSFLYVANRGHNSIAAFGIDSRDGTLTRLEVTPTEPVPRSFTITGDGRHFYVAGEASGRIAVSQIMESGRLKPIEVVEAGPVCWQVTAVETVPKSDK